jgi:hypothetical protein
VTEEQRYLGTPLGARATDELTGVVPAHLPGRLCICLWDFSWLTQAGPGEPYEDLDLVMRQTVERGYNTVRICAVPLLLFGGLGLDALARDLEIEGLGASPAGDYYGQKTRWYNVRGGYRVDARRRLWELFEVAKRHSVVVILSSWEYQQTTAFAESEVWFEKINAVPLQERLEVLSRAWHRMLMALDQAGYTPMIALVELHNEVDFSLLPPLERSGDEAITRLQEEHPDVLITASYGKPPHLAMFLAPEGLGAAQFHVYSYGVLDALQRRLDIRAERTGDFPNRALRKLLLADAPTPVEYGTPAEWKLRATVVTGQMIYGYDWIDADLWDAWLVDNYGSFREVMLREIESRVVAVSEWARWKSIPAVVGEGWVGYTPLRGGFEEGPIGLELAEYGVTTALEQGVWGMVLCSNAAPHHPMWGNVVWQKRMNATIRDHGRSVDSDPPI